MLLKRSPSGSVGFTLIEVVAVLIILGILTAVAVGRSMDSGAELVSQTDVIKSHLRYAQSRAMAMEEVWGIRSTGSGYYLFRVDTTNKITLPGEESDVISLADKGIDSMTVGTFSFDDEGQPLADDGSEIILDRTIQLNGKDAITIVVFTGYIS